LKILINKKYFQDGEDVAQEPALSELLSLDDGTSTAYTIPKEKFVSA
jgi:hypothetical protein